MSSAGVGFNLPPDPLIRVKKLNSEMAGSTVCLPDRGVVVIRSDWTPKTEGHSEYAIMFFWIVILFYTMVGIAVLNESMMLAIHKIISVKKTVTLPGKVSGEEIAVGVRVWNMTVANCFLISLASSIVPIIIPFLEILGNEYQYGSLGPHVVLGCAAFNILMVWAAGLWNVPGIEKRRVHRKDVLMILGLFSLVGYAFTYGSIEIWTVDEFTMLESGSMLLVWPFMLFFVYVADHGVCQVTDKSNTLIGKLLCIPPRKLTAEERKHKDAEMLRETLNAWGCLKDFEGKDPVQSATALLTYMRSRAMKYENLDDDDTKLLFITEMARLDQDEHRCVAPEDHPIQNAPEVMMHYKHHIASTRVIKENWGNMRAVGIKMMVKKRISPKQIQESAMAMVKEVRSLSHVRYHIANAEGKIDRLSHIGDFSANGNTVPMQIQASTGVVGAGKCIGVNIQDQISKNYPKFVPDRISTPEYRNKMVFEMGPVFDELLAPSGEKFVCRVPVFREMLFGSTHMRTPKNGLEASVASGLFVSTNDLSGMNADVWYKPVKNFQLDFYAQSKTHGILEYVNIVLNGNQKNGDKLEIQFNDEYVFSTAGHEKQIKLLLNHASTTLEKVPENDAKLQEAEHDWTADPHQYVEHEKVHDMDWYWQHMESLDEHYQRGNYYYSSNTTGIWDVNQGMAENPVHHDEWGTAEDDDGTYGDGHDADRDGHDDYEVGHDANKPSDGADNDVEHDDVDFQHRITDGDAAHDVEKMLTEHAGHDIGQVEHTEHDAHLYHAMHDQNWEHSHDPSDYAGHEENRHEQNAYEEHAHPNASVHASVHKRSKNSSHLLDQSQHTDLSGAKPAHAHAHSAAHGEHDVYDQTHYAHWQQGEHYASDTDLFHDASAKSGLGKILPMADQFDIMKNPKDHTETVRTCVINMTKASEGSHKAIAHQILMHDTLRNDVSVHGDGATALMNVKKQKISAGVLALPQKDKSLRSQKQFFCSEYGVTVTAAISRYKRCVIRVIPANEYHALSGDFSFAGHRSHVLTPGINKVMNSRRNLMDVPCYIVRANGTRGRVQFDYHTEPATAAAGIDFEQIEDSVTFEENEEYIALHIPVKGQPVVPGTTASSHLYLHAHSLQLVDEFNLPVWNHGMEARAIQSDVKEQSEPLDLIKNPRWGHGGSHHNAGYDCDIRAIYIHPPAAKKPTWKASSSSSRCLGVCCHTKTINSRGNVWANQIQEAMYCGGSPQAQKHCSSFDYTLHLATIPWKVLLAFIVPPPQICGGWVCLVSSITLSIILVGLVVDIATFISCYMEYHSSIIAVTLLSIMIRLPDLLATMASVEIHETADDVFIGVLGANNASIFLGLGLAFLACAWKGTSDTISISDESGITTSKNVANDIFYVPSNGPFSFGLTLLFVLTWGALMFFIKRRLNFGAEFGGPYGPKVGGAVLMFSLWVGYIFLTVWRAQYEGLISHRKTMLVAGGGLMHVVLGVLILTWLFETVRCYCRRA